MPVNGSTAFVSISGASKSKVLSEIFSPTAVPHFYPAQLIQPTNGELHWFVDQEAFPTGNSQ